MTRNRLDYLRWSCDQLAALLRGHQERKARLEAKAGAVVAVLNVFAGFVLTARWPASTGELGGALLAFRLLALAALSAVLACWFFAVKCGPSQGLNPVAFTADDGTTAFEDWAHRYARVRQTLLDALASVNPAIEHRAKWILRCEAVAAVAYALLLVVLVLEVTK